MKRIYSSLLLLLLWVASIGVSFAQSTIYKHTFAPNLTTYSHPYTVLPTAIGQVGGVLHADILANSWSNHTGAFTSSGGATGQALSSGANMTSSPYVQVQLTLTAGYELVLTGYNFWRQRSSTGPTNGSILIGQTTASTNIGAFTIPTTGASIGSQTLATPIVINGPTVTIRLNLTGATSATGTFRLDDFELIGFVRPAAIRTVQNGLWQSASTWEGGVVPANDKSVEILHTVTTNANVTRAANTLTTIAAAGILDLTHGLELASTADVMVNGILRISGGGYLNGNSPRYAVDSWLEYKTGGHYNRSFEWSALNGTVGVTKGYPDKVEISLGSQVVGNANTLPQGGLGVGNILNVLINSGLHIDGTGNGGPALDIPVLRVLGTLTLPVGFGRDLWIRKSITFTSATSTFNHNFRGVILKDNTNADFNTTGKGSHYISNLSLSSSVLMVLPYVVIENSPNGQDVEVNGPVQFATNSTSPALSSSNSNDRILLTNTPYTHLTIGSPGYASHIGGAAAGGPVVVSNATAMGNVTPSLTFQGVANASHVVRLENGYFKNLTNQITGSGIGLQLQINGEARFATVTTNTSNTMRVNAGVLGANTLSGNGLIVDGGLNPSAYYRQYYHISSPSFMLRDDASSANGSNVSTIQLNGPTGANTYVDVQIVDNVYPGYSAPHAISRYFNTRTNLPVNSTTGRITASYTDTDVVGTESLIRNFVVNSNGYVADGSVNAAGNTLSHGFFHRSGSVDVNRVVPVFAVGKPQEIEVKETATNVYYAHNSTYDLGTVEVGENGSVAFTIENVGADPLLISSIDATALGATFALAPFTTPATLDPIQGTAALTLNWTATTVGTQTGYIIIHNTDSDEGAFRLNFTLQVVPAQPKIKVNVNANANTIEYDEAPNNFDGTIYAATNVGAVTNKTFQITNLPAAVANLLLTGSPIVRIEGAHASDFSVTTQPTTTTLAPGATVNFTVRFAPSNTGLREATIVFENNHAMLNPFKFHVQGNGQCPSRTLTMLPDNGPVGTTVRIMPSMGTLTSAVVTVDGIPASVTEINSTTIEVVIPDGATYGAISIDQGMGCTTTGAFVLKAETTTSCVDTGGGSGGPAEIYISEVTDASSGSGTYIELTNPGSTAIVLTGNYSLNFYNNGNSTVNGGTVNISGTIQPYSTFVVAVGFQNGSNCSTLGGDGSLADQYTNNVGGVNFNTGGCDHIKLTKNSVNIDEWGVYQDANWANTHTVENNGIVYRRKPGIISPTVPFNLAQWDFIDWAGSGTGSCATNDYSHIGTSNLTGNPPVVVQQPIISADCSVAEISIAAFEGINGGAGLTYQWYMHAPGQTTWTLLTNAGDFSNVNSPVLTIANYTSYIGYQFYNSVGESTISCSSASNAIKFAAIPAKVWNGTAWAPNAPTGTEPVQLTGNYDTAVHGSFSACSMVVDPGVNVVIANNTYIKLDYNLTVGAGADVHVVEGGQFIQTQDEALVTNNGTNRYTRTTTPFVKFDYTYWSSPVIGSVISSTFAGWRLDYAFWLNTANFLDLTGANGVGGPDGHDDNSDDWVHYTGLMEAGRGYAIMGPTNLPAYPATRTVEFNGTYHTGEYTLPIALSANPADDNDDFNLVGNPYPSAISADAFILANPSTSGSLYFWTHSIPISDTLPGNNSYNFSTEDYAIYNLTGAVGTGTPQSVPTGWIGAGQGFIVDAESAGNVRFSNAMRVAPSNSQFYRYAAEAAVQKDRYWARISHANGLQSQTLIGYFADATLGKDFGYDAVMPFPLTNAVNLYTLEGDELYRIQGRSAFEVNDVVKVGYTADLAGTFTIELTATDGIFSANQQAIYLHDLYTNTVHDFTTGAYTFHTEMGVFEDRFVFRYIPVSELGTGDWLVDGIRLISNPNEIGVRSAGDLIESIQIYSLQGQLLHRANNVAAEQWILANPNWARQNVIVHVKLQSGREIKRTIAKY